MKPASRYGRKLQAALEGEPDPWFELQEAKVDTRQFEPLTPA
jgi:nitrite reductase (NADH) large subunit